MKTSAVVCIAKDAGTSEGHGGKAFSNGTFGTVRTVITSNIALQYSQTIKHLNKARVLSTSHKY